MNRARKQLQPLLLQHEQEVNVSLQTPGFYKRLCIVFFIVAIFLIAGGTVIWVLNIVGTISGPWSSVFGAVFAGGGIIVALLDSLLALMHANGRQE